MTSETRLSEQDELLRGLLLEAGALLTAPQIYVVAEDELRGLLALRDGEVDGEAVAHRRLSLKNLSVVCRAALDGVAYLGSVAETDPCVNICPRGPLEERGLVVAPVTVAGRSTWVLLGHPRERCTRELRDHVLELTRAVSVELCKVLAGDTGPGPALADEERGATAAYGHPAVSAGAPERGSTTPYGHPAVRPPTPQKEQEGEDEEDGDEVFQLTRRKAGEEDRRRYARFPVCVQVSHISEHNFFTGFMEDVSEGGLFIATHQVFPVGHRFELEFALPGQPEPWVVLCEVRWVRVIEKGAKLIPGMGVRFVELSAQMLEQIRRFARKRPPMVHRG